MPTSNRPGFTLLELIISVAITALLSTLTFGAYVKQNRADLVQRAAQQVAVDFQQMFTAAQSGQTQGSSTLAALIGSVTATLQVTSSSSFATSGVIQIDSEQISYNGVSGNVLNNLVRGFGGTTAAVHSAGAAVAALIPNGYGVYFDLTSSNTSYESFVDSTAIGTLGMRDAGETVALRKLPLNTEFVPFGTAGGGGLQDNGADTSRVDGIYQMPGSQLAVKRDTGNNNGIYVTATGPIRIKIRHKQLTTFVACVKITPKIGSVNLTCS